MNHSHHTPHTVDRPRPAGWTARFLTGLAALLALAALAAITASHAAAIDDAEELTRFGGSGSGAGELTGLYAVATDPVTGHVYVVEGNATSRISEFTPWGNFVKAVGWDVAPGAVNEQQEVRVRASAGQFKLTFDGFTTTDLAFNAPGPESKGPGSVEAALNALPSIGGAGGSVSVEAVPGTPDGKTPTVYVIAFKGSLAGANLDQLTIANGTTELSGGAPTTVLEARTRVEGHSATSGLESCTAESECKAGLKGPGVGQFGDPRGLAVDAVGNVYVRETTLSGNGRVQKFDSAGRFVLMFGGEVNKTAVELREEQEANAEPVTVTEADENLCTAASGDVCGTGVAGNGNGQFGASFSPSIALGSGGKLFAGDIERIQRFNLEGEYEASIPVSIPVSSPPATVHDLALAPGGDFYASVGPPHGTGPNVRIVDAMTGAETGDLEAAELEGTILGETSAFPATKATLGPIAIDPSGNVFVRRLNLSLGEGVPLASSLLQFDPAGKQTSEFGRTLPGAEQFGFKGPNGLGTNAVGSLYAAVIDTGTVTLYGPPPVNFEGAPPVPPQITAQFATSVGRNDATVSAEINPNFFSDTRYYVQYGTGKCSEGGCTLEAPLPPGPPLTTKAIKAGVKATGISLSGLAPDTTYHYRFVAESSGGGPVRGVGGKEGLDGDESSFTTYPIATLKTDCPNQKFRTGFSAPLTDCRAFEMVSPLDKNNGDIKALLDVSGYTTALNQSALDGESFTYSSYRGFANPNSAPYVNQYLASRKDGVGWLSESLNVSQTSHLTGSSFDNQYKAFSADLCQGWVNVNAAPVLDPDAPPDYPNIYRRDNCGEEGHEALIQVAASDENPAAFFAFLQGTSVDGRAAIFTVQDKLTEEAPSGLWQAYYASKGDLHLICVLPSGSPSGANCSAGTAESVAAKFSSPQTERLSSLDHALSTDGSKAYWTDSGAQESGSGKIYLRLNPGAEQSEVSGGECTEEEKACTLKVSETKTTQRSRFLGASADGAKALFEVTAGALQGDLYLFDAVAGASTLLAGETLGVAGRSEDLSRIYFISKEVLPETSGASAGKPNLYLDEGGTKTFVATLSATEELLGNTFSNGNPRPIYHIARATPNGGHLVFVSSVSLTGYDNTDQITGKADSEVYLYKAGSAGPVCVSCNPSGARPLGQTLTYLRVRATAGWLTMPGDPLYSPRVISSDGQRLFFNSFDPLLPRDTNGKADVYEWQAASDAQECKAKGAELYVPSSGGCLSLISSGQSPSDSELLDTSPDGTDVFFTTNASLLPQDPGLFDVYDARANGGLPAPPEPPGPCQGEACQFGAPPPNDPTPASASFKGAGNPSASKPRPRCGKGKARRKGRCVSKRKQTSKRHNAKRANNKRRASR